MAVSTRPSAASIRQLIAAGQSIWLDEISRPLIDSGKLAHLIDAFGVSGLTSNPTIFARAIADGTAYEEQVTTLVKSGVTAPEAVYLKVTATDIRAAADLLRPVYDETGGHDGFVSIEVPPAVAHDTEESVAMGRQLWASVDRPNLFVKIPATSAGVPAIRQLLVEGINVNVTLLFSLRAYEQVATAYLDALEERERQGRPLTPRSVASFFVSRVDSAVDPLLEKLAASSSQGPASLVGRAAIANARCAREIYSRIVRGQRFQALQAKGARPQRLLWASTSTKNPAYADVMYVEALVGADTINTMPRRTLDAFADHGRVSAHAVDRDWTAARQVLDDLAAHGVDMEEVTRRLLDDGLRIFQASYDEALAVITQELDRVARR